MENQTTYYHRNDKEKILEIVKELSKYGIIADPIQGSIHYGPKFKGELPCRNLYFVRHADTEGTQTHRFMSDNSSNSRLTAQGKDILKSTAHSISSLSLDAILYSEIPRVLDTALELQKHLRTDIPFIKLPWMKGIENKGWEGQRPSELRGIDLEDYTQREIRHNIFAKSRCGCSWGDVLLNASRLLNYLIQSYQNKDVLLVSQGSLVYAMKLLLRLEKEPWYSYETEKFYGLSTSSETIYGRIQKII